MGLRLYERISEMHSHGICHRDLHIEDIVLADGGLPLFVDPDFALESDPSRPCYDLAWPRVDRHPRAGGSCKLAELQRARSVVGFHGSRSDHRIPVRHLRPVGVVPSPVHHAFVWCI
jgi:serine/threonine protein kinase